jgi:hypothetical protein
MTERRTTVDTRTRTTPGVLRSACAALAVLTAAALLAGCSATPEQPAGGASAPTSSPPPASPAPTPAEAPSEVPIISATDPEPAAATVAPTRVRIPEADIDMTIVPVGVEGDGWMELPDRVDTAGWYRFGSGADSPTGTVVVAAHVDSLTYGVGAFSRLIELPVGTVVELDDGTGASERWTISSVDRVAKAELPTGDLFDRAGDRRLALITCGGEFDRSTGHYRDNVVVVAEPAP